MLGWPECIGRSVVRAQCMFFLRQHLGDQRAALGGVKNGESGAAAKEILGEAGPGGHANAASELGMVAQQKCHPRGHRRPALTNNEHPPVCLGGLNRPVHMGR